MDDRELIEQLHDADMRASKAQDYRALRTLLSDDPVMLPPGGSLIRGREAIDQSFAKMGAQDPPTEVLEYRFDWQEVHVLGDYAYEWGYVLGSERDRKTEQVTSSTYQVMRILQRQADGSWRVHRSIWNEPAQVGAM